MVEPVTLGEVVSAKSVSSCPAQTAGEENAGPPCCPPAPPPAPAPPPPRWARPVRSALVSRPASRGGRTRWRPQEFKELQEARGGGYLSPLGSSSGLGSGDRLRPSDRKLELCYCASWGARPAWYCPGARCLPSPAPGRNWRKVRTGRPALSLPVSLAVAFQWVAHY